MFFQLYFCHCNRTYIGRADKKRENNIYHETIICFVLRKINAFQLCCYYRKNRQHTSPLVIRSDLLKHVQTCWNTFQSVQINPFKPVETRWNTFQSVQICRNTFTPVETRFPPSPSSLGLNILIIMYLVFNCVFIVFNEIIQKHLETFLLCPC